MAKSDVLYIPKQYQAFAVNFLPADTTTLKTLYTAPADDANLIMLSVTSTDTAARDLLFYYTLAGTDYLIGHIDVPASAGSNGTVNAVNGLNATNLAFTLVDDTGVNRFLPLKGGAILKAKMAVAVTASTQITVTGVVADYTA
jgi:hypothetical protein